jgi:Putative zinc-finger
MDHHHAKQLDAVEKYLLDELTPEVRDDFEEHFFDCQECAIDLRVTAGFIDSAKEEFKVNPVKRPGPVTRSKLRLVSLWPSALVWSALAASLLVIAYQNVVVYPHFKTEIAELKAPEILPSVSLVGGNSRGGQIPVAAVGASQPFLLLVDIPAEDRFSSYTCQLYSPSGSLSWRVEVSPQQAKDTVSIRVPSANRPSGEYTLTVQGNTERAPAATAVDLAHYYFTLNSHT